MNLLDTRLRLHDPAAGADSAIPEHVLHQILAEPQPIAGAAPRRSVARRRLVLAVGLAGVSAFGVVAGPGLPGGAPGLAERAYAATAPVDVVIHSVRTGTLVLSGNPNIPETLRTQTSTTETWQHGKEVFANINQPGYGTTTQALSDGFLKIRTPSGELQTTTQAELDHGRPSTPWSVDPVLDFRQAYDEDRLTETGTVTFAGRTARRFVVPDVRSVGKDATDVDAREFFIDPGTAEPLGMRQTYTVLPAGTGARTQDVSTVVIDRPSGSLRRRRRSMKSRGSRRSTAWGRPELRSGAPRLSARGVRGLVVTSSTVGDLCGADLRSSPACDLVLNLAAWRQSSAAGNSPLQ